MFLKQKRRSYNIVGGTKANRKFAENRKFKQKHLDKPPTNCEMKSFS